MASISTLKKKVQSLLDAMQPSGELLNIDELTGLTDTEKQGFLDFMRKLPEDSREMSREDIAEMKQWGLLLKERGH